MARRVVLTDRARPDIERAVLQAVGFELVTGPAVAGSATEVKAQVAPQVAPLVAPQVAPRT